MVGILKRVLAPLLHSNYKILYPEVGILNRVLVTLIISIYFWYQLLLVIIKCIMDNNILALSGIYAADSTLKILSSTYGDNSYSEFRLQYLRKGLIAPSTQWWTNYYQKLWKPLGKLLYENVDGYWQLSYPIPINLLAKEWVIDCKGTLVARLGQSNWKIIDIPEYIVSISVTKKGVFVSTERDNIWYVDNDHNIFDPFHYESNVVEIKATLLNNLPVCYILNRYGDVNVYMPFNTNILYRINSKEQIYALTKQQNDIILLPKTSPKKVYIHNNSGLNTINNFTIDTPNINSIYAMFTLLTIRNKIYSKPILYKYETSRKLVTNDSVDHYQNIYIDYDRMEDSRGEYEQNQVDYLRMAEDVGDALLAYDDNGNYPIF